MHCKFFVIVHCFSLLAFITPAVPSILYTCQFIFFFLFSSRISANIYTTHCYSLNASSTAIVMASTTLTRPTLTLKGKHSHASATSIEWHFHRLSHCLYKHSYGLSSEILPACLQNIYFYCSYSSKTFIKGHESAFKGRENDFRGHESACTESRVTLEAVSILEI